MALRRTKNFLGKVAEKGAQGLNYLADKGKGAIDKTAEVLGGTPAQFISQPIYSPEQQSILSMLLQMGQGNLNNPQQGFGPIEQDTLNNFFQQIVPGLKEGFSASGNNAYSSPQLQTNLSSAGAGLAERLAAMRTQYGMQNQQTGLQQLSLGLNPLNNMGYQARQPGFLENFGNAALGALPILGQLYGQHSNNQNQLNLLRQFQQQ
jgi:hypothetical protein